jgi:multiple sugar transport system substrate-binding protein
LNIASWVWGAGGDFVTPDGKRTVFSQPAAQKGVRAYFALGKYLPLRVRGLNGLEPDTQFLNDAETAMTMSGPWLFQAARANLLDDLGAALPPGPSFVGGSYLVVWKHSAKADAARRLNTANRLDWCLLCLRHTTSHLMRATRCGRRRFAV